MSRWKRVRSGHARGPCPRVKNEGDRRLGAVDRGRAADDHAAQRLGALAGGEQLQGADHVDLVQRPGRLAAARGTRGSRSGRPCRPRSRGSSREITGLRMSASMNSVRSSSAGGGCVSIPAMYVDLGVALEPPGELGAPVARDPGDRDPATHRYLTLSFRVSSRLGGRPRRALAGWLAERPSSSASRRSSTSRRRPTSLGRLLAAPGELGAGLLAAARELVAGLAAAPDDVVDQVAGALGASAPRSPAVARIVRSTAARSDVGDAALGRRPRRARRLWARCLIGARPA